MPRKLMQAALWECWSTDLFTSVCFKQKHMSKEDFKADEKAIKPQVFLRPLLSSFHWQYIFHVQIKRYEEMKIQHKCLLKYFFNSVLFKSNLGFQVVRFHISGVESGYMFLLALFTADHPCPLWLCLQPLPVISL